MDPTRGILIAGNWKMNHGAKATVEFAAHFKSNWTFALADYQKERILTVVDPTTPWF